MGKIEIIGILKDFTLPKSEIIEGSHMLEGIDNMNPINWLIFAMPIVIIILIINIIKQKKYGMLNKEIRDQIIKENIKKYNLNTTKRNVLFRLKGTAITTISFIVFFYISIPIHELLHAVGGIVFGKNVQIGFIPIMNMAVAIPSEPLSKFQNIIFLIIPILVLGIIPAIIGIALYPKRIKNHFIAWIITCISCCMILSASADIIAIYNICTNVPNNASIYSSGDDSYWYIPKENKK